MKESAEIALSYVRSHAEALGLPAGSFDKRRFHLHVPAGAVPKDGPSAGVTMTTALVCLLTGRPVKSTVGMTGEVTLSGRVLPIGGVKQKVLAAHRAGLTEVILPARNGPDLDDVPEAVREAMTFHLAEDIGQVWLGPGGRAGIPVTSGLGPYRSPGSAPPPEPGRRRLLPEQVNPDAARIGAVCGRSQFRKVPEIIEEFGPARVGDIVDAAIAEEAFPKSVVPGLVLHKGERVISAFSWAFFDDGTGHNARLETAPVRPAWRDAYASGRLVLPLARFVEGRAWFSDPDGAPRPSPASTASVRSRPGPAPPATMLTRPADDVVAPFHERMPVILPSDLIAPWLAGEAMPLARLLTELARPPDGTVDPPRPSGTRTALAALTAQTDGRRDEARGRSWGAVGPIGPGGRLRGVSGRFLDIREGHAGEELLVAAQVLADEARDVATEWRKLCQWDPTGSSLCHSVATAPASSARTCAASRRSSVARPSRMSNNRPLTPRSLPPGLAGPTAPHERPRASSLSSSRFALLEQRGLFGCRRAGAVQRFCRRTGDSSAGGRGHGLAGQPGRDQVGGEDDRHALVERRHDVVGRPGEHRGPAGRAARRSGPRR